MRRFTTCCIHACRHFVRVRSYLHHVLAFCLATTACSDLFEPDFPPFAVEAQPPLQYRVWWEVVESCSGRTAPFSAVSWYRAPIGSGLQVKGESAAGVWFESGNRIVIADGWKDSGPLVRHEMLHAILHTGSHPREQFRGSCTDEVLCGRDCLADVALPGAIPMVVELLEVDADLFPSAPSLTVHDGKVVVVVRVRNPATANVFVPAERFAQASCAVGFVVTSTADSSRFDLDCTYLNYNQRDARVYFRPGETRRLLFEVDLRVPTRGGLFRAEAITLSAILVDRVRVTDFVMIQP